MLIQLLYNKIGYIYMYQLEKIPGGQNISARKELSDK
jgi:hypothetical protein